ncbi:MAG: HAD-IIB family hydrolase [Solobacterium sp.]|nr:HAD-IIB family hydrolase [Solobacterium sp.]
MISKLSAIAADIDGTLVNKGENIMPLTKQAITQLHEEGVLFGLATGRKIGKSIFDRKEKWGLSFDFDFLIGMNGGQLWDRFHDEIESYYMLDTDTMHEILEMMEPLGLNASIYEDDHMVSMYMDTMIHASMKRNGIDVILTNGDMERLCVRPNYNLLFRFDEAKTEQIKAYANLHPSEKYMGTMTSPGIIEFMDPRVNKGLALRHLARRNNIPVEEIMAFGDMDNDKELLWDAGWGVCLINGTEDTKAAANAITEYSCTEDGMGRYLFDHWINRKE